MQWYENVRYTFALSKKWITNKNKNKWYKKWIFLKKTNEIIIPFNWK